MQMSSPPALYVVPTAERSVVGSLLQQPQDLAAVRRIVGPGAFEDPMLAVVYQTIIDVEEAGEDINVLTVAERIERNGRQAEAPLQELLRLIDDIVPVNAVSYASVVARNHQRSLLARLGQRLIDVSQTASNPADVAALAVDYAQRVVGRIERQNPLLSVEQLAATEAAQTWAVKGVIQANSVGMLFGASGSFKSFIALDFALHVAYGMPWLGRKTRLGLPVYLAAEGGAGLMRRIAAWHKARNMDWRQCPLRVVIQPMQFGADARVLRDAIDAAGIVPTDIIIDTLSQTFCGEENSSTEVARYLTALGADLRAPYGATVVVVHHVGHNATERPRGSSAMLANLDWVLGCFRDEKEMVATVESVKLKDGSLCGPWSFRMDQVSLGQDEDGDEVTSLRAAHISGADEILAATARSNGEPSALSRLLMAIGTGAPEDEVRQRFYKAMPDAETDTRRQAYFRALKRAIGQQLVVRTGDWLEKAGGHQA